MENGRLLRHFGLLSEPFRVSPRQRDFYPPGAAPVGLEALIGGGSEGARVVLVSGEPGVGRTTALRRLAGSLRSAGWSVFAVEAATVPHPEHLSHDDILRAACRNFGLFQAVAARDADALGEILRAHAHGLGASPVAIGIDDAERLADTALAGLVHLVAAVPAEAKTPVEDVVVAPRERPELVLLLSGPPGFSARLDAIVRQAGENVADRAAVAEHALRPLGREEVRAYVTHCLDAAGYSGRPLFDDAALDKLMDVSHGVLGELNAIAAQSLIFAWQASRQTITSDLIEPPGALPAPPTPVAGAARGLPALRPSAERGAAKRKRRARRFLVGSTFAGLAALAVAVGVLWPEGVQRATQHAARLSGLFTGMTQGVDADAALSPEGTPPNAAAGPSGGAAASVDGRADVAPPGPATRANVDFLLVRGNVLLRGADAVSARRFFARAAETGSADAATAMGASYDPIFLEENAIRGVDADAEQAMAWYRIAAARGDASAGERLNALLARPDDPL